MKTLFRICFILLPLSVVQAANSSGQATKCSADPFAAGCLNEKAVSEKSVILCNDNTVIPADQVSSASGSQDACINNGGINAFMTEASTLQVVGNNNVSSGGTASSSGSAGTGTGVDTELDLDLTTTTGVDGIVLGDLPVDTDGSFVVLDDGGVGATSSGTTSSGAVGTPPPGPTCKADGESCYTNTSCGIDTCSQCCNMPTGPSNCDGISETKIGTCGGNYNYSGGSTAGAMACLTCE